MCLGIQSAVLGSLSSVERVDRGDMRPLLAHNNLRGRGRWSETPPVPAKKKTGKLSARARRYVHENKTPFVPFFGWVNWVGIIDAVPLILIRQGVGIESRIFDPTWCPGSRRVGISIGFFVPIVCLGLWRNLVRNDVWIGMIVGIITRLLGPHSVQFTLDHTRTRNTRCGFVETGNLENLSDFVGDVRKDACAFTLHRT